MTPQLQMAIKLLQLSRLELMDTIRQELEENPALEEVQEEPGPEKRWRPPKNRPVEEPTSRTKEVTIEEKIPNDIDWSNYIDEYNSAGRVQLRDRRPRSPQIRSLHLPERVPQRSSALAVADDLAQPKKENIGSLIIGNLDKDGYLEISVEEIAEQQRLPDGEDVEEVLSLLQSFDPIGVCARDLKECLLIQARHLGLRRHHRGGKLSKIISTIWKTKITRPSAKALKVSIEEVIAAVNVIKGLEPKPGASVQRRRTRITSPRISTCINWKMNLSSCSMMTACPNSGSIPSTRRPSPRGKEFGGNAKDYIQDKMRSAAWLIRSIHQRQKTIYKVMESILKFQRDFFEKGIAHLKPMVLRDVAEDIDMHESTISRVTTNKYAYTPQGIFELKYFFNSSINRVHGEAIASASVQEKIRQIIEGEDPEKPLQRQQDCQNAKADEHRHCTTNGCQVSRNDGGTSIEQTQTILRGGLHYADICYLQES